MKVCTGCKETKLLTEFYGKLAQCKHCNKKKRDSLTEDEILKKKEYAKKWREENKDYIKECSKKNYEKKQLDRPIKPPKLPKLPKPPRIPKIPITYKDFSEEKKKEIAERNLKRISDNLPRYLWELARSRAGKRNIEFSIDISDIIIPEKCPILGLILKKNTKVKDDSISLDRVDPSKGYVKGNILVISYLANAMKRNANLETLQKFALWALSLESL